MENLPDYSEILMVLYTNWSLDSANIWLYNLISLISSENYTLYEAKNSRSFGSHCISHA